MDSKISHHTRHPIIQLFYQAYMFVVQIILLNMLIALMAESNDRVRAIAKLVAQFERAKLILHWERRLHSMRHSKSQSFTSRLWRMASGLPSGTGRQSVEHIFPRWLHVLVPPESHGGSAAGDTVEQMAITLKHTNMALSRQEEHNSKMARAISNTQEETKRLGSLLVDMQEKNTEMLRGVVAGLAGEQERRGKPWKVFGDRGQQRTPNMSEPPSDKSRPDSGANRNCARFATRLVAMHVCL